MDCNTSGSTSPGRMPNFLVFRNLSSIYFCRPGVNIDHYLIEFFLRRFQEDFPAVFSAENNSLAVN
jgi:hypothetical protein